MGKTSDCRAHPNFPEASGSPAGGLHCLPSCLSLLAAVLLLSQGQAGQSAEFAPEIIEQALACYVFIGQGSGVLISADGEILSNHHVVGDQPVWSVVLADGRTFEAELLGGDPFGDLSLLRLREAPPDLAWAPLASAEDLRPGRRVLAIGNPFGLGDLDGQPTLTLGSLSTGRIAREGYTDCVQLDAAVNPGNSGGPLFDSAGRLLGINGQIRTRTGMRINSGIGLAIAAPQIAAFLPALRQAEGRWVRHSDQPRGLRLRRDDEGVLVEALDRPEASGLLPGDRLLRIAGRPLHSPDTAVALLRSLPWQGPGTSVAVELLRDGTGLELQLELPRLAFPGRPWFGFRSARRGDSLQVIQVDPDGPAARAGLSVGMSLHRANETALQRPLDLLKVQAGLEIGDELELEIGGGEMRASLRYRLPPAP